MATYDQTGRALKRQYDVSLEILQVYINAFPDSALAVHLSIQGEQCQSEFGDVGGVCSHFESGTSRKSFTAVLRHVHTSPTPAPTSHT